MSRTGLPSGTVTFLFTDIEGSTKLLHELGAAGYDRALAAHRRVLRDAFLRHDGVEVDTQGDAFFVVFPTAAGALKAAAEGQHALASGPIRVRMGLHTGTAFMGVEGYVGADVHLGARIAASGHGGQVLLSRTTQELVEEDVEDIGEHRLKDFDEPVWIFQLGSERFPPLKTISNTNLPRPASSFVGRERELVEVLSLLRNGDRVVTLSGPGGSGKTRLAIEAATELVPEFRNGVYWIGLAALRDPTLVVETVAQTVGAEDGLAEHIGDREMLLLLDNFEHVVDAAPELSSVLPACPNLRVLVTSRELLRIQGEREYAVPPLAEQDAVELFCRRSGMEPDKTIADLCSRLDNLPLAVELAAARANVLSAAQILERLSQRLDLFRGGRDADPRQQTLRATIAWSHSLLEEEERALFARLAVFRGGCTLEAAAEVADATIDTLQSLVDKSLLRHTNERFWLLETIHDYARERLAEGGAETEVRRRHAAYFLRFAEQVERETERRVYAEPLSRIAVEHDNLRGTLEWARDANEGEVLVRVTAALTDYWNIRDLAQEARTWLEVALETPSRSSRARATVLLVAGIRATKDGDFVRAESLIAQARDAAEEIGDTSGVLLAMNSSAHLARAMGDRDGARRRFLEIRNTAAESGNRRMRAFALVNLGLLELDVRNFRAALEYSDAAVDAWSELGDETGLSTALGNCGWCMLGLDDPVRAEDYFRRALAFANRLESTFRIGYLAFGLAAALVAKGEEERGVHLLGAAAAIREQLDIGLNDALEEEIHERTVTNARAALGEEAFASAWDRGRAMKPEEIVRFCGERG